MANIVIKDLEMDKELDNVSLLQIIGGHRCFPPRRICVRRRVKYLKKVVYLQRKVTYVDQREHLNRKLRFQLLVQRTFVLQK